MCSYQQFLDNALGKGVITLKKDEKTLITQITSVLNSRPLNPAQPA